MLCIGVVKILMAGGVATKQKLHFLHEKIYKYKLEADWGGTEPLPPPPPPATLVLLCPVQLFLYRLGNSTHLSVVHSV